MIKNQSASKPGNIDNEPGPCAYILRLFVTGASPNSTRAISNLKKICEEYLKGQYELEIIDVYQQPLTAEREQLIALPLLIKKAPGIERRLIGDMSNKQKVLKGLGIEFSIV
jgi:circadian clock protein KaiB